MKGEEDGDHAIAKLTGSTLTTLQQCLVRSNVQILKTNANMAVV